jgi:broad specificity phosphatase PhoE
MLRRPCIVTEYIFVRHAECKKNLADISGGEGATLTEKGIVQATQVASELAASVSDPLIMACPTVQTIKTAEILATALRRPFFVNERLIPAGMGVVGGLSTEEVKRSYPEYARLLAQWRHLEIEAHELKIPGIEPPAEFWHRTIAALALHKESDQVVVVATRSIMVWAVNLSLGHSPEAGGGYKHIDISNCQKVIVRR